jgi:DHA1 family bicyclomycin/chloramphenicol resistance-like MFS transporter
MERYAEPARATRPSTTLVLWLSGALFALQPLSTDLYLPTLPAIAADFGASVATVQWTLSTFIASFACAQLIAGPLSDRFGRLPVIVGGVSIHCAASLMCWAAPSILALIAGRMLQAIGACTCIVAARAIARDLHEARESARLLAASGAVMSIAIVAGPTVGAQLQLASGWRAAFGFLTVNSLLLAAICARRLSETNRHLDRNALAPKALWQSYAEVLRSPAFRAFTLANVASYGGLFAFLASSSFVLIRVLQVPVGVFGFFLSATVSGYLFGTLWCRRLMRHSSLAAGLHRGAIVQVIAGLSMAALALGGVHHVAAILVPQFVFVVSHGVVQPLAQAGAISGFPRRAGAAAALAGFFIQISAAGIGALMGLTWNGTAIPMALTVATASLITFAVSFGMVRHHGHVG